MKAKYIPNILSVFRIMLALAFGAIFILWYPEGAPVAAVIFAVAGISDVADGIIARRFGFITNAGKILDPLADKLMQCISLLCLVARRLLPLWLLAVVVAKELTMAVGAIVLYKKSGEIGVAKKYGKAYTVVFYAIVLSFIFFGDKINETPAAALIMCLVMAACGVGAVVLYYISYLKNNSKQERR